jgi:hypothetical protein
MKTSYCLIGFVLLVSGLAVAPGSRGIYGGEKARFLQAIFCAFKVQVIWR